MAIVGQRRASDGLHNSRSHDVLTPTAAGMLADDQPAGEATEPPAQLSIATRIGSHQMRSNRALVLAGQGMQSSRGEHNPQVLQANPAIKSFQAQVD